MEPQLNTVPLARWFPLAIIVTATLSLLYICLGLFGYGRLSINVAGDTTISINGHNVHSGIIKVHPGTYTITAVSPLYSQAPQTIRVGAFQTKTVSDATLTKRTPTDIVRSAIGGYLGYGAPLMYDGRFFQNNTWMAGTLEPGSAQPVALHYVNGEWQMVYFGDPGYDRDLSALPAEVAGYVQEITAGLQNG